MFSFFALIPTLMACIGGDPEVSTPTPSPEPAAVEPAAEPEPAVTEGYIVGQTALRKAPSDDKKIPDPENPGKQVSNFISGGSFNRGELVTILGEDGEWSNVRASDGKEGWIKTNRMVKGEDLKVGTLYTEGKVFQRPDLLALDSTKKIEAGSLIFLLEEKDQFASVDYPRSGASSTKGWTLKSDLVFEASEIEVAKLIGRIRQLRADNNPEAKMVEELARSQFAGSQLLTLLDTPEEPATDATDAPTEGDANDATPD